MNESFHNAANVEREFGDSAQRDGTPAGPQQQDSRRDADHGDRNLDELEYDPPQRSYDPNLLLEPTPFGTVFQEVRHDLDADANRAIDEVQQQEPTAEKQFDDLRSHEDEPYEQQDPESSLLNRYAYDSWLREQFHQEHEDDLEFDH